MMRRYRDSPSYSRRESSSYRDGQLGWNPDFVSQDNQRYGALAGYRPYDERPPIRPFGVPSLPSDFYPTTRVIIMSNSPGQRMSPRLLTPPSHGLTPRFNVPESMQVPTEIPRFNVPESMQVPREIPRFNGPESMQEPTENNESKLTKQEQGNVLSKLKKEIYNPMPKILARRVSLYYRDLNRDPNTKATEKHRDEDKKSCPVCLEDFKAKEEVMVTPCSHMFHEECIVPWVKNHGQCPVCRASFIEKRQNQNALPFNNNSRSSSSSSSNNNNSNNNSGRRQVVDQPAGRRVMFGDELLSLIQAMDEAFPWRM